MKLIAGQGRLITLSVSGAASNFFSTKDLFERGAVVTALVDCLERAGHSVRLIWVSGTTDGKGDGKGRVTGATTLGEIVVPIKDFGEALNIGRMAFVLCHAAMFRRLGFSIMEQFPVDIRYAIRVQGKSVNYGLPAPVSSDLRGDVVLDEMMHGKVPTNIAEWVEGILKQQGISLRATAQED